MKRLAEVDPELRMSKPGHDPTKPGTLIRVVKAYDLDTLPSESFCKWKKIKRLKFTRPKVCMVLGASFIYTATESRYDLHGSRTINKAGSKVDVLIAVEIPFKLTWDRWRQFIRVPIDQAYKAFTVMQYVNN